MKYLFLFLAMVIASAVYADPCNYYFRCPYEVSGDSRQLSFATQGGVIENRLSWRDQDVNGNQAVLCVRGGRDVTVFTNSGCVEITRDDAGALLSEPRHMPYMDGETLRFADGQEGRPLETVQPHPQALEMLEAVR